jgi:ornithine carbamoyltransferase
MLEKDLLTMQEMTYPEFVELMELTAKLKRERFNSDYKPLNGRAIGMIFAKSSTRTRVSFEVGIGELGGQALYLDAGKMQVGRGETVADTARVLERYLAGIVIRTYKQSDVEELAQYANIPVINALTDDYHPCQILADLFTIIEHSGSLEGIKVVFYGDGASNMANSLIIASAVTGIEMVIAAPEEYRPRQDLLDTAPNARWEKDPLKAAEGADYIYGDVFVSMGFEEEKAERLRILAPYQINAEVFSKAKADAKFLHCLPAHRGEEVSAEIMDSPRSIVFDQAENRLHVQKAVLCTLFNNMSKKIGEKK